MLPPLAADSTNRTHRGAGNYLRSSVPLWFRGFSYRSGSGITARLRCPFAPTARTAKKTLSFDIGSVTLVTLPTSFPCCQSPAVVSRHKTSYDVASPPGEASHASVVSFCNSLVRMRTLAGGAGADARDA